MASAPRKPLQGEGDVNSGGQRAEWQARTLEPQTQALLERDARVFLHQSLSTPCLSAVRRAQGAWLEDTGGRRYLDFHGNNVHHLGYGHPAVKAAIRAQIDDLPFAPRRYTCEPAVTLAERLADIAPSGLEKVLFMPGGSEAVEVALKVARAATGRFKTVSFWDSFHGAGFGAASVGGEQMFRSGPIGPLMPGSEHIAPFACYRCAYGHASADGTPPVERCQLACASYLEYVLEREGDVAAVVAEPMRAVPYVPPPGYWQRVRDACDRHGALLIFDEIPTGLGKTGRMFACEHDGVVPDIMVLGKALGGGILPLAAVLCQADLDVGGDWAFGHYTHEKNPVMCRAGLATLEVIEGEGLVERTQRLGRHMAERLAKLQTRHSIVGSVRGRGLLHGLELVTDRRSKEPAHDLAESVLYRALDRGLSFKVSLGSVLTLSPPLTITADELDFGLDRLEQALSM